ncbi:MAG: STY4526/YPO1902 family pathogenicity island replication protein [Betaproteobacteria bacterium]|nr:STY4526/YPO1902 family pathogenicity island replication protein [Betaproteobacteria bacterium]
MSLSLRSLVLWGILTGRQKFALPEELRQLPVRELPAYLNGFDGKVTLTLRSLHSPDAMRRMQEVEALKEDFLRRGASAEIMHWLFRLSKRQVQQMRRQFGLRNVVSGRPRRLGRDQEYEIFASWEKMRDQGMSYPQIMLNLSEQYPDVSMVSLYAVIKRMI